MRVYIFLIGTKANILNWINSDPRLAVKNKPEWEYPRLIVKVLGDDLKFIVKHVHSQVFQLIPDTHDWKLVCKAVRRMKLAAPANVKVASRNWIKNNYPSQYNLLLKNGVPVSLSGDDPTSILDYDPTDAEINNDIDPTPESIGIFSINPFEKVRSVLLSAIKNRGEQ